jgi:type I restriction enzyme S subunit
MTPAATRKLGDVIQIKHGFAFESRYFVDDGPYVLLTPGNFEEIGGFRYRDGKQKHYEGPVPAEFVLEPGDLLVAMTEQGEGLLGSTAFVPSGRPCLHNQRLGLISARSEQEVDRKFIYYLFNWRQVRAQVRASSSGTKVRHTSPSRIYAVQVPLPEITTQQRIASILGAYDDLIEVNRRRIALVEGMMRRLFEDWFVRFRFPGHEPREIIETPDGPLPKGWQFCPLEEMLILQRGFDLPATARTPGPFPVISANGVHGTHADARVKGPGIVTGRSGTIGTVLLVHEDHWPLNTTLFVKEFRRASPAYSLYLLRQIGLRERASGSAVPTLNRNHLHGLPVVCPPRELAERYEEIAMAECKAIRVFERQRAILASSRDLLLPRLMSGELSVPTAEHELETAA